MKRGILLFHIFGQRARGLDLVSASDNRVEIIRAGEACAHELEAPEERQPPARRAQRRDRYQVLARAHGHDGQAPRAAEMRPPGVEPFPREERRLGRTRGEQLSPLRPQRREPYPVVDYLDGHDILRFRRPTCSAT